MTRQLVVVTSAILLLTVSVAASAAPLEPCRDGASGRMYAIRVTPPAADPNAPRITPTAATLKATADAFIQQNLELIGLHDPAGNLLAAAPETDKLGLSHVHYFQRWHGLDVLGGEITVHINRDGHVYYVKTKVAQELPADTTPTITEAAAQKAAMLASLDETQYQVPPAVLTSRLLVLPLGLVKNEPSTTSYLAWEITVVDDETGGDHWGETYYLDAHSGAPLFQLSLTEHLTPITREVYDCAGGTGATCQLDVESTLYPGYFHGRGEGMPPRGPYPNPSFPLYYGSTDVDSLYSLLGVCHNYYSTTYGVDGANGFGGAAIYPAAPAYRTRGVGHPDTGTAGNVGCPANASYTIPYGSIFVCRGMVVPDVLGHEYAHAVVYHSFFNLQGNPIGPIYYGQAGSLNEGYADVMGEILELAYTGATDWKARTTPFFPPIRDIKNPPSLIRSYDGLPFPDRFYHDSFYCGTALNQAGVHMNSTVPSHAMYLIAEGGEHNGCDIQAQGVDVAQQIFFRGWRTYFSREPSFNEACTDLIQACADLYPPAVVAEVTKALQAVEMDQPGLCSGIPEVAPACAVNHGGTVHAARSDATPATSFEVGQEIWLSHTGATANRTLDYQLLPRDAARPIWQATTAVAIDTASGTVQPDSTLFTPFGVAMTVGSYDLMIDGNRDGHYQPWADTLLPIEVTAASAVGEGARPTVTALKAIQPNPTRQGANVAFSLARPTDVTLRVYDVAGRLVRTIAAETLPAGTYVRAWDGRDDGGRVTGSGLYFVKLVAGSTVDSRKLVRTP